MRSAMLRYNYKRSQDVGIHSTRYQAVQLNCTGSEAITIHRRMLRGAFVPHASRQPTGGDDVHS